MSTSKLSEKDSQQIISSIRSHIDECTLGKAPQSVLSKEQMGLLKSINDSALSLEEKNSLLRYLYFSSIRLCRCLESDLVLCEKQRDMLSRENDKLRDRSSKSSELINRLQDLNKVLSDELDVVKTKERNMVTEEKRIREQLIEKFMGSLDELNTKVEENSNGNTVLLEENNSLRMEYNQKVEQFREQARLSKEMISKLQEINVIKLLTHYNEGIYEKQLKEMNDLVRDLGGKAKDADVMKKSLSEYEELSRKQDEVIKTMKQHRDKLTTMVQQYETLLSEKKSDAKSRNKKINELTEDLSSVRKELIVAKDQKNKLEALCRYLQKQRGVSITDSTVVENESIKEISTDDVMQNTTEEISESLIDTYSDDSLL